MRRASSRDFLPASTSPAVKPARTARSSSSRIARSTRSRFCGAKIDDTRNSADSSNGLELKVV